jgi:peroxiredoxin family protein
VSDTASFSLVIHAGVFGRVHYGLVMASAAAAVGRSVTILFAGEAVAILASNYSPPDEDARNIALGIASFDELLSACHDLKVRMIVCETALAQARLKTEDLRTDLTLETGGFVTYLNATNAKGQSMFV